MSSNPNNSSPSINSFSDSFLDHLMGRLQVQDSDNQVPDEDFFSSDEEEEFYENEEDKPKPYQDGLQALYKEESRIEEVIVGRIVTGRAHTLKPNSGDTVIIRESSVAVGFHLEEEGKYLVWEWHGHMAGYTGERGYFLEYFYGNYFQRIVPEEPRPPTPPRVDAAADKGLKDLFGDAGSSASGRILHRNLNAGSVAPRL